MGNVNIYVASFLVTNLGAAVTLFHMKTENKAFGSANMSQQ
jgi:hypothetical protein